MSKPHGAPEVWYRRIQGTDAKYLVNYDSIFRKPNGQAENELIAACDAHEVFEKLQYAMDHPDLAISLRRLVADGLRITSQQQ